MNKLIAFVRLDFKTVKPYFKAKNLLIFASVAVFLSVVSGSVLMSIGIGFMLGTLFVSYPFAVGERSNIDALYRTLSISRGTVVRGRYLFVFVLNLLAVLGSFVCASIGLFVSKSAGAFQTGAGGNDPTSLIISLTALLVIIQIVQLPLFFRLGYTKAKFMSIVPFVVVVSGFAAIMSVLRDASGGLAWLSDYLDNIAKGGVGVPLAVIGLVLCIFVSYNMSLKLYRHRDF
jgi:hypothetical protein